MQRSKKLLKKMPKIICDKCDNEFERNNIYGTYCPKCNNLLQVPPIKGPPRSEIPLKSMWSLTSFLPSFSSKISLFEGNTPTISLQNIKELKNLKVKLEFRNPTGTFRDRACSLIMSDICSQNKKKIISASTGSFGISLSAYAARGRVNSLNYLTQRPRGQ